MAESFKTKWRFEKITDKTAGNFLMQNWWKFFFNNRLKIEEKKLENFSMKNGRKFEKIKFGTMAGNFFMKNSGNC